MYSKISKVYKSDDRVFIGEKGAIISCRKEFSKNFAKVTGLREQRITKLRKRHVSSFRLNQRTTSLQNIQKEILVTPNLTKSQEKSENHKEVSETPHLMTNLVRNYSFMQGIRGDFSSLLSR